MTETIGTESWAAAVVELEFTRLVGLSEKLKAAEFIFKLSTPKDTFLSGAAKVNANGECNARFRILAQSKAAGKHAVTITTTHKSKVGKFTLPSDIFTTVGNGERSIAISSTTSINLSYRTAHTSLPHTFMNPEPKNMILFVDSLHVIPGQTLSGFVCYSAPEPSDLAKGVLLHFVSKTEARWKDEKSKYGNIYSSESNHMNELVRLPLGESDTSKNTGALPSGVFVWSFEITLPLDVPATWRFGKSQCVCYVSARVDLPGSESKKKLETTRQLRVAAVPMPPDPFNLQDFDYGETDKIAIKTTVDPIVQIGAHLVIRIEVQNNSHHPIRALKVKLVRQNIFAGNLEKVDAGQRGLKYHTPEQSLRLSDKIQGESWPLAPGVSSALQITVPLDPKLSPSVSRARSWNACRQYCLLVCAKTSDLINPKKACSANPIMLVHEPNPKQPTIDPSCAAGTLSVSLIGAKPVQKAKPGSGLTLGMTPRGSERSSSVSTEDRYSVSDTPNTNFWDALRHSLNDTEKKSMDRAGEKRSSSKRSPASSRRERSSSSSSSSSDNSRQRSSIESSNRLPSRTSEDIAPPPMINLAEMKRQRRRSVNAAMETPKAPPPSFVAARNRRNSIHCETPRERSSQSSSGSQRHLGSPSERQEVKLANQM